VRFLRLPAALLCAAFASSAFAHVGEGPPTWSLHWTFEPWVIACLLSSAAGYALGLHRLWRHAGVGRGVTRAQALAFAGGWLSLVIALVSPLDALGVELFSAHMLQHELLMVVAAPLLCLSRPLVLWTWALSPAWRRRVGGWTGNTGWRSVWGGLTAPATTWGLHAVALWGWHLPLLFEAALHDNGVHTLQHVSFLGTALLFWWSALKPSAPSAPSARAAQGRALVYLFTTMVHTAALGALLTLSSVLWYPSYQATSTALGLDPLEDQQLGGLVMWVPAGLAYIAAGLALAMRWAGLGARAVRRSSHTESPNSWVR
jgi:putative membrane protein